MAQSSGQRSVIVPFSSPGGGDGYLSAQAPVTYAFIACAGEVHIAYSLNEGAVTASPSYRLGGKTYPATGAPPQPSSIHFAGTVYRGPQPVGSFNDGLAGKALGMGCFSGQSQQIGTVAKLVGPKATQAEIVNYFNQLRVVVQPTDVLRNASLESSIRGEQRRQEMAAAETKRKADADAQAKARQEADARAAVIRQQQDQAQRQASVAGPGPAPGRTFSGPAPSSPPPLTAAERAAKAIASDKVLADQRLADQRRIFAQQQAALAEQQQRQNEALVAAAPAILNAAGGIYGALEAWDQNVKDRAYQAAQAKLAGQCLMPNGQPSPKDGDIQLGVEHVYKLSKADCGTHTSNRFKAMKLELPEQAQVQFTIKPALWRVFTSFQIDVQDLQGNSLMFMSWEEWGGIQKVNTKSVSLPPGVYIVKVSNGVQDIFADFNLRVDAVGAGGKVVGSPPSTVAAAAAKPVAGGANAGALATRGGGARPASLHGAGDMQMPKLALGQATPGAIAASDPRLPPGPGEKAFPTRCYSLPTEAGRAYQVTARKGAGSTNRNLLLTGPYYTLGVGGCEDFKPLMTGWIDPTGINTKLKFTSGGGDYVVRMWSNRDDFQGDTFELTASELPAGRYKLLEAARAPAPVVTTPTVPDLAGEYAKLCAPGAMKLSEATCVGMKRDMAQARAKAEMAELNAAYERVCGGDTPQLSARTCAAMKAEAAGKAAPSAPAAKAKPVARKAKR